MRSPQTTARPPSLRGRHAWSRRSGRAPAWEHAHKHKHRQQAMHRSAQSCAAELSLDASARVRMRSGRGLRSLVRRVDHLSLPFCRRRLRRGRRCSKVLLLLPLYSNKRGEKVLGNRPVLCNRVPSYRAQTGTFNSSRPEHLVEHTKRTRGNAEQRKATHAGQATPKPQLLDRYW